MIDETLIHAAQRVIRFVKIDDTKNGGLLSRETIKATDALNRMVMQETARNSDTPS